MVTNLFIILSSAQNHFIEEIIYYRFQIQYFY